MSALAVVVAAALCTAIIARRRPSVWICTALVLAVAFPRTVTRTWFSGAGDLGDVHPAVWLFAAGAVATASSVQRSGEPRRAVRGLLGALAGWIICSTALVGVAHGTGDAVAFLRIWATPAVSFIAVLVALRSAPPVRLLRPALSTVLSLAGVEAVLALTQRATGTALVFEEYRSPAAWLARSGRAAGTFDTPLDLAAFLSMSLALVHLDPVPWRRHSAAALIVGGILCTGSRVGLVIAAVVLLLALLHRRPTGPTEVVLASTFAVVGVVALTSPAIAPLFQRFGDRGRTSTWARELAFQLGLRLTEARPLSGNGLVHTYRVAQATLPSSFENAYLSLAAGAGLLVLAGVLAVQTAAVLAPSGRGPELNIRALGVLSIVWGFSYSSYAATNNSGVLTWFFLAVGVVALAAGRSGSPDTTAGSDGNDGPAARTRRAHAGPERRRRAHG